MTNSYAYGDYIFVAPIQKTLTEILEAALESDKATFEPLPIDGIIFQGIKVLRAPIELDVAYPIKSDAGLLLKLKDKEVDYV